MNRSHAILTYDETKGELRIDGRRYAAIDMQNMCRHLDSLVGPKLAETIMNNHERRLGAEDAERIRELNPNAKIEAIIRVLTKTIVSRSSACLRSALLKAENNQQCSRHLIPS